MIAISAILYNSMLHLAYNQIVKYALKEFKREFLPYFGKVRAMALQNYYFWGPL